jgi:hypothetical protein
MRVKKRQKRLKNSRRKNILITTDKFLYRGKTIHDELVYGLLTIINTDKASVERGYYISNVMGMPYAYQVFPSSVSKYTGLNDKFGDKIFENDVILITDRAQFTGEGNVKAYDVVFRNGCFMADYVANGNDDISGKEIWDTLVWHELYEGAELIQRVGINDKY